MIISKIKHVVLLALLLIVPLSAFGIYIPEPDKIVVEGIVSLGEDGAAWLKWNGHEILVTSGYMIGRDLRAVAIRHDSVVLYSANAKQYHVLTPKSSLAHNDRTHVIWTEGMPIWKITRMVGLAYRKDYICHHLTKANATVRSHVRNTETMMNKVVSANHRFYARDGVLYVAPVHVQGNGWRFLMRRIQNYRHKNLADSFAALNETGTIVCNGRPLDQILESISFKTGVRIIWEHPVKLPLFCSLRDRTWHEIIATIVIFNGYTVMPTSHGLVIR